MLSSTVFGSTILENNLRHERFEWDESKANANVAKHRIKFEEAVAVLADPFAEQSHTHHQRAGINGAGAKGLWE